jgi:hypothetical protein
MTKKTLWEVVDYDHAAIACADCAAKIIKDRDPNADPTLNFYDGVLSVFEDVYGQLDESKYCHTCELPEKLYEVTYTAKLTMRAPNEAEAIEYATNQHAYKAYGEWSVRTLEE